MLGTVKKGGVGVVVEDVLVGMSTRPVRAERASRAMFPILKMLVVLWRAGLGRSRLVGMWLSNVAVCL